MSKIKVWLSKPDTHSDQPLLEWYVEQCVIGLLIRVCRRAMRRNDSQTERRLRAVILAGAEAEQAEAEQAGVGR